MTFLLSDAVVSGVEFIADFRLRTKAVENSEIGSMSENNLKSSYVEVKEATTSCKIKVRVVARGLIWR
jgi:hypothetical protein